MKSSPILITIGSCLAVGALFAVGGTAAASSGSDDGSSDRSEERSNDRSSDRSDESTSRSEDRSDRRAKRREIRKAGACTGSSRAKIKVKGEDRNRIEMEFEVDQNRNGQRWGVAVKRNGRPVLRKAYRTRPPSGSFEARKLVRNLSGKDRFVATTLNPKTGERCTARVTF
ncbi:MAG: hypothetical protein OEM67_03470 [Thermoleophilia bacterium]|nr:hypothetical protein [Thermoleophilia bacterium]